MKAFIRFIPVLVIGLLLIGCGSSGEKKVETKSTAKVEMAAPELHKAHGATMNLALHSEELYSCSMHPDIVSAVPALCPLCGSMELVKMDDAAVKNLRENHPVGCPMCPVVTTADEETKSCPMCKMDLVAIGDENAAEKGHEGHGH